MVWLVFEKGIQAFRGKQVNDNQSPSATSTFSQAPHTARHSYINIALLVRYSLGYEPRRKIGQSGANLKKTNVLALLSPKQHTFYSHHTTPP